MNIAQKLRPPSEAVKTMFKSEGVPMPVAMPTTFNMAFFSLDTKERSPKRQAAKQFSLLPKTGCMCVFALPKHIHISPHVETFFSSRLVGDVHNNNNNKKKIFLFLFFISSLNSGIFTHARNRLCLLRRRQWLLAAVGDFPVRFAISGQTTG